VSDTTLTVAEPPDPPEGINISGGTPVGGVRSIEVTKGEQVKLLFSSDEAGEIHVHGYELEVELDVRKPVPLSFKADIDGKFEIELHAADGEHAPVAELTVQPG
jgi:hypothetical protein